jgi:hypothetical protein
MQSPILSLRDLRVIPDHGLTYGGWQTLLACIEAASGRITLADLASIDILHERTNRNSPSRKQQEVCLNPLNSLHSLSLSHLFFSNFVILFLFTFQLFSSRDPQLLGTLVAQIKVRLSKDAATAVTASTATARGRGGESARRQAAVVHGLFRHRRVVSNFYCCFKLSLYYYFWVFFLIIIL